MLKIKFLSLILGALVLMSCTNELKVRINPTPQKIEMQKKGVLNIEKGFIVEGESEAVAQSLMHLNVTVDGVPVSIMIDKAIAQADSSLSMSGSYILEVNKEGIFISAYDMRGAFYAIQTLKQLAVESEIPYMTITDYPNMPYRGVVEGFYGTPWSHETRVSLLDFYGKFKMNSYLYGPKDDPYHSSPYWRLPYPEEEAQKIKDLVEASTRNYVDFIWAIHPGKDIQWTESDYQKLYAKFESMYDLGIRSFALFFDDIEGIGTRPDMQAQLLNRLHEEFVEVKGDVSPLIICPTDYTKLWANPAPDGYLALLGKVLHPSIHVMWTGDFVCGDITPETLDWVSERIKRPSFIWWNYPVTDYVRNLILQGPVYGLDSTATTATMAGFVSNPMEHGEASKLALYGVADYTWNIKGYEPMANWEAGLEELMPAAKEAYRTFAIHSCDTETGYRRDESWETETFSVEEYTQAQFDALMAEFKRIEAAPATIDSLCTNRALANELRPWLVEFEKLGIRGQKTLELIKLYEAGEYEKFWNLFEENRMNFDEQAAYLAHKSGTLKLQPFIENATDALANKYYSTVSGTPLAVRKAIGTFANLATIQVKPMFDGDKNSFYTSGDAQKDGSWIGMDLGEVTDVKTIIINQGRNVPNDVDYFDMARLEYSLDGENWQLLRDEINGVYDVIWEGTPVQARYVRLARNDASERQNWVAVRSFEVNPVKRDASIYTNVERLVNNRVTTFKDQIVVKRVLEVITLNPGEYVGVELPYIATVTNIETQFNAPLTAEYSQDGMKWSTTPAPCRYIRYINNTASAVGMKMDKFDLTADLSGANGTENVFDKNFETTYTPTEEATIILPEGVKECTILMRSANGVKVKQLSEAGEELAMGEATSLYYSFAPVADVKKIAISGNPEICEIVYKY